MISVLSENADVYPAFRHHRNGEDTKIVHNKEEDGFLDDDWADCPAAFETQPVKRPGRPKKDV